MFRYDITFCSHQECANTECERHLDNVKGYPYPVSVADMSGECDEVNSTRE